MTYATLMVHMELGQTNNGLLKIAGDLAERFHAGVIGIAARQPTQMIYGEGYIAANVYERDRGVMVAELKAAELELRTALGACTPVIEWRTSQTIAALAEYVASEVRSVHPILTDIISGDFLNAPRNVNTGDLIMLAPF